MSSDYPILEFDATSEAIIEPSKVIQSIDIPEHCVLPIYQEVIDKLNEQGLLSLVKNLSTSLGPFPVYSLEFKGQKLTVAHPGLCAPFASAILEEIIALGCQKFIACGSAGVLDKELFRGTVVIPNSAIRDEGTSYHYIEPSREIVADADVIKKIEGVLKAHHVHYKIGKTWTTDGLYRETKNKIKKRKSEGCLTVEMECSAFIAVCNFRGVKFGQLLAAGDDVSGDEWDRRYCDEYTSFPEKLFWLSVEACLEL